MSSFRTASNGYGQFWFGGNSFPGFLYKKNVGVGGRRSTRFTPGGTIGCNQPCDIWNKYTPGSGVGASSVATRRAKIIYATSCNKSQQCGKFYTQLAQNQIRVSPYTHGQTNGQIPMISIPIATLHQPIKPKIALMGQIPSGAPPINTPY